MRAPGHRRRRGSISKFSSFSRPHRHTWPLCSDHDRPAGPPPEGIAAPMQEPAAPDDLPLLAERLRLGLPLRGFDGREIPLRTDLGDSLCATEAAHALLLSGASLLSAEYADAYVCEAIARAGRIEAAARL